MRATTIIKLFCSIILMLGTTSCAGFYGLKKVKVISNPSGAIVSNELGMQLGKTPVDIYINKKSAKVNQSVFAVSLDGYQTYNYIWTGSLPESKEIKVRLKPIVQQTPQQEKQRVNRDNAGKTDMEKAIIRWNFDSDPRGARIFWRVISSVPDEVKNTNENYLGTTPYEETRSFNILGLTYDNSKDVTVEIKLTKRGYEDQVKRFNVRMALDQQEISGFFELVEK